MPTGHASAWWTVFMVAVSLLLVALFNPDSVLRARWEEPIGAHTTGDDHDQAPQSDFSSQSSVVVKKDSRSLLTDGNSTAEGGSGSEEPTYTSGVNAGNYVQVMISFFVGFVVMAIISIWLRIYINAHPHLDTNDPNLVVGSEHWVRNFGAFGQRKPGQTDEVEQEKGLRAWLGGGSNKSRQQPKKIRKKELYRQKSSITLSGKMEVEITAADVDCEDEEDDLDIGTDDVKARDEAHFSVVTRTQKSSAEKPDQPVGESDDSAPAKRKLESNGTLPGTIVSDDEDDVGAEE